MPLNMLIRILISIPPFASVAVGLTGIMIRGAQALPLIMLLAGSVGILLLVRPRRLSVLALLAAFSFGGLLTLTNVVRPLLQALIDGLPLEVDVRISAFQACMAILFIVLPLVVMRRLERHEMESGKGGSRTRSLE